MKLLLVIISISMVLSISARSEVLESAIVLDTGYVVGPRGCQPEDGTMLFIFGHVAELRAPFEDILPTEGAYEVTYVVDQFTCDGVGNWDDDFGRGGWMAEYRNGFIRIYLDDTPESDFSAPITFRDGVLLIEAQYSILLLGMIPSHIGMLKFTGGTLFSLVSDNESGYYGENIGSYWCCIPDDIRQIGYVAKSFGTIDVHVPVPTEQTRP